ncbi:tyrosine-type recombinase/integrase [Clostridium sp.]|uniref:tyrosine-type recombinase/integrase n=1 Tax=Clostridium sp. TaxID=1506 RepID=UPI003217300D
MYCFTRAWKRFLDRINVDYRKFHALRHTYATKQFEDNSPLKIVSELLGHTDIYIIMYLQQSQNYLLNLSRNQQPSLAYMA